jgi:CheY-like chemotaxis protein
MRIRQVVRQMLTNAIRSTPGGGCVSVALAQRAGAIRLQVTDAGRPMSAESMAHVFDCFGQSDANGVRAAGLGLGLAIASQLVELHGGSMEVHSDRQGQGATFTVTLPVAGTGEAKQAPANVLQGVRVLLVDQAPDARSVIRWVLEQSGADVSAAASPVAALEMLERSKGQAFHLLVCDISSSGQDARDLFNGIRAVQMKRKTGAKLPAVALAGDAGDDTRRRAAEAGFDAVVPKPVDPIELVSVVAGLAGRGGANQPSANTSVI